MPRIVYNRVCLVDASCNAYPYVPDAPDPLAATTMRHDVAIRWEWAEPIPLEANVGLNQAPRGYPTAFSPLGLFAVANPTLDDLPVSIDSTRAIAGEVAIDADRMAITIAPQDCLAGNWAVEASINLGTMYGGPVCGEEPGTQVGYGATFVLR